jgi:hypothetical protein
VLAVGALVALLVPGKRAASVSAIGPVVPANDGLVREAAAA